MIEQIIRLKEEYNLLEDDFNLEKAREWYRWAIKNGFVELIYEKDKLVGFAEWITAKEIPKSLDDYPVYPEKGNVLIVGTLIARRPYIMWKLKSRILSKNKNRTATIWYRKKNNRLAAIRRKKCLNIG